MDEDKRRMRPDILQAALLDEVAERLLEMTKIMEEERAFGAVEAIEKFTITSQRNRITRLNPWMSMTLINDDGANSVFVIVNTDKSFDEHEVLHGETYTIDMHRPRIADVLLWCRTGETATVRIVGVR
jgi:hypothetical protein